MAYEVLARKWRPQQFDDVVGQDHVTQTLRNAIETDRLAHAYLFVGPRGIGKTSLARIMAKALNCEHGPTFKPCDKCDACREIVAGNSLDVLEIDGASNNGVEQVRDLRDTVKYAPARGPHKIYIIDEVHMLSVAAFNALLKTLEEPPAHVKFIFATTEPTKVLATIISRCQRFDLRRIPIALIMDRLRLIAKDEKVKIDDDALLAIARGAEGGLRDAESAFDQLISFKGRRIVEEDVLSVFGLVSRGLLEDMAQKILDGDVKGIIRLVADLDARGKDLQRLAVELMGYFRNLLVCVHVGDDTGGLDLPESQVEGLRKQAAGADSARLIRIVEILTQTEERMKFTLSKRTLTETALIRCARAATVVTLEEILEKIRALRGEANPEGGTRNAEGGTETAESADTQKRNAGRKVAENSKPSYTVVSEMSEEEAGDDLDTLRKHWGDIIDRTARIAPLVRGSLMDSGPLSVTRDRVLVGCDPGFSEDLQSLKHNRNHAAVERVIGDFLKRKVSVEFIESADSSLPAARPGSEPETDVPSAAPEDEKSAAVEESAGASQAEPPARKRRPVQEWARQPVVQKSLDMFDGYIMEVRE